MVEIILVQGLVILNELSTLSEIIFAMASDEVAPGDGALQQWRIIWPIGPSPYSNMKSSTRLPSFLSAWARTPDGPRVTYGCKSWIINQSFLREINTLTSARVSSGINFWSSATWRLGKIDCVTSFIPAPMYRVAIRINPTKLYYFN